MFQKYYNPYFIRNKYFESLKTAEIKEKVDEGRFLSLGKLLFLKNGDSQNQ